MPYDDFICFSNGEIREEAYIGVIRVRTEEWDDGHWGYPWAYFILTAAGKFEITKEDFEKLNNKE